MNRYSEVSKQRLATCHRDLQTLFNHVCLEYDNTIVCGQRGEADQNKAFAEGKSTKKYPESKHNKKPSDAVDSAPFEKNGIDWKKEQCIFYAGYVLGVADQLFRIGTIKHRIKSGIDWDRDFDIDDTTFWDAAHFEIIPNENDK